MPAVSGIAVPLLSSLAVAACAYSLSLLALRSGIWLGVYHSLTISLFMPTPVCCHTSLQDDVGYWLGSTRSGSMIAACSGEEVGQNL